MPRWTQTVEERFWAKVDKTEGCWLWTAAGDSHGYGQMRVGTKPGKLWPAHRLAWTLVNGDIEPGLFIDHMCFTRQCVRPSHLRLATNKQNHENRLGAQANSSTGIRGVSWSKAARKWRARVKHFGIEHHIGLFETLREAEAAVIAKRNELYTHNALDREAS
jgi:hypothetical protein